MTFALNEEEVGTFEYFLKVTAVGGEVFWSDERTFTTECGSGSTGFQDAVLENETLYLLDGNLPYLEIELGPRAGAEVCTETRYELRASEGDKDPHPDFPDAGIVVGDVVTFTLNEEKVGDFAYVLKVTSGSGEEEWSPPATFTTACGEQSARIEPPTIDDEIVYLLDGNVPILEIDRFTTEQALCPVESYALYRNKEDAEVHSDFEPEPEYTESDSKVVFTLVEEKEVAATYFLQVTAVGGEVWWTGPKAFTA